MSAQVKEQLLYQQEVLNMTSEPLRPYLATRPDIRFIAPNIGCWRGYVGYWEMRDDQLWLVQLRAWLPGFVQAGLDHLFPGQEAVFAHWYIGALRVPQGEVLKYIHMGYETIHERDLLLDIEADVLTGWREIHH
jgi:hypothetical protein